MDEVRTDEEAWAELLVQEQRQEAAQRLNVDPADVKPCFARIGPIDQGNRDNTAFVYGTELRRMGVAQALAWADICRWNRLCRPPLSQQELESTFRSAWEGEKTYGCRGALAASWCIGRRKCDWHKQNVGGRRKCRETDFLDFGWPLLLKSREVRVYVAVVRLEQAKGVGAGGLVIASTREYVELSGVGRRHVMGSLDSLESHGLVAVMERGERRQLGLPGRACHVRRVVPIPEPPVGPVNERRAALCD
jgi:hypothetical protein